MAPHLNIFRTQAFLLFFFCVINNKHRVGRKWFHKYLLNSTMCQAPCHILGTQRRRPFLGLEGPSWLRSTGREHETDGRGCEQGPGSAASLPWPSAGHLSTRCFSPRACQTNASLLVINYHLSHHSEKKKALIKLPSLYKIFYKHQFMITASCINHLFTIPSPRRRNGRIFHCHVPVFSTLVRNYSTLFSWIKPSCSPYKSNIMIYRKTSSCSANVRHNSKRKPIKVQKLDKQLRSPQTQKNFEHVAETVGLIQNLLSFSVVTNPQFLAGTWQSRRRTPLPSLPHSLM